MDSTELSVQAYEASEQLRALLQSEALGGLALGSLEDEEGTMATAPKQRRNYSAIQDWNNQAFCRHTLTEGVGLQGRTTTSHDFSVGFFLQPLF